MLLLPVGTWEYTIQLMQSYKYMKEYRLTKEGVFGIKTHKWIPNCFHNRDWKEHLKWVQDGNIPEPELKEDTDEDRV